MRQHENFMSNWSRRNKQMMINQVWLSGRQKKHKMQSEKPTHEKGTQVTFPRYIFSSLIFPY